MSNKRRTITLWALVGTLGLAGLAASANIPVAQAAQEIVNTVSSMQGSKDCSVCQTRPAVATKSTSSSSSSSSSLHVKIVKSVKQQTKQYEKAHNVIIAINQKAGGVASLHGCVDPVKKGWIKPGGQFKNSRSNGGQFWDEWQSGRLICNPHRVKIGDTYWMHGTKDNCGNEIWIQVSGPRVLHKIIPVITFNSAKSFTSVYNKWVTKSAKSSSTSTTTTGYTCDPYGAGWNLSQDANGNPVCKNCPPTPCPTTTTTPTTTVVTTTVQTTTTTTPPPTFTMSWDTINDIPAGTCRPEVLHVTSSVAGQVQARPDVGLISTADCKQPDTGQLSTVSFPVSTGSNDYTVYVYEPTDSSATSDTLTAVPLIAGVDAKSNTATTSFTVSHPTRP